MVLLAVAGVCLVLYLMRRRSRLRARRLIAAMAVRKALGTAAILLGGLLVGGCATAPSASLSGRLIRPGEPTVDLGGPPRRRRAGRPVGGGRGPASARRSRAGRSRTPDPELAAALLVEAAVPTAANHLRVAAQYRRVGVLDAAFAQLRAWRPPWSRVRRPPTRPWRGLARLGACPTGRSATAQRAAYCSARSASAQNTLGTMLDALGQIGAAR